MASTENKSQVWDIFFNENWKGLTYGHTCYWVWNIKWEMEIGKSNLHRQGLSQMPPVHSNLQESSNWLSHWSHHKNMTWGVLQRPWCGGCTAGSALEGVRFSASVTSSGPNLDPTCCFFFTSPCHVEINDNHIVITLTSESLISLPINKQMQYPYT